MLLADLGDIWKIVGIMGYRVTALRLPIATGFAVWAYRPTKLFGGGLHSPQLSSTVVRKSHHQFMQAACLAWMWRMGAVLVSNKDH